MLEVDNGIVKLESKRNMEFKLGRISVKYNLSINISTIVT